MRSSNSFCFPFSSGRECVSNELRADTDSVLFDSGHVSAITVSPQHRRLGLASMMMDLLEKVSERDDAWL